MRDFEVEDDRLTWRGDGETIVVQAWGTDSLRVRSVLMGEVIDTDYALLALADQSAAVEVTGSVATITNGRLTARLTSRAFYDEQTQHDRSTCAIEFLDGAGEVVLRELGVGGSLKLKARAFRPIVGGDHALRVSFEASPGEKLYGMGQYQQEILDIKGSTFELAHRNSQASVPFVHSSLGYGFLWHDPAIGRATFAANRTEWTAESTRQLDYWVTVGDTPTEITRHYTEATGRAPMMPEHGLGFWQCKLRYSSQEELLAVAREHKRRGLPMDVIVADFFHWPQMGDFRFEEEFWPDPKAMVTELGDLGIELMVSVWPQVAVASENYAEFRRRNFLVKAERGMDVHMSFEGPSAFYDVTNPAAREHLWALLKRNYVDHGITLFWLDEAEPEYGEYDFDNYRYHLGSNVQIGNLYPQLFARAVYDGQVADGITNPVNLLRCAWAGSQRYGALVWSGDIHSTFTDLRRQVVAGLHMGIAGIPWFTTDIGGFHDGDARDPAFRELLVRWFQFGVFCPVMRLHGDRRPYADVAAADGSRRLRSGGPNELWSFGEETYAVLADLVHLRELLRPYTRDLMAQAHRDGTPVMRAMFYEFPGDERCWDLADQYMYGPDLLVAPVMHAGVRERSVYLPAGTAWIDAASGARHEGGVEVRVDAPLEVVPVFVREGAEVRLHA